MVTAEGRGSLDTITVAGSRLLTGRTTRPSAARMSEVSRALATTVGG